MLDPSWHHAAALAVIATGVFTAATLVWMPAPYGRHGTGGWGPQIPPRWGWILMECPSVFAFLAFYLQGKHAGEMLPLLLLFVWQAHYIHRTLIFPFRLRNQGKPMPLSIAAMGMAFNLVNSWLNATQISEYGDYSTWQMDPRLWIGLAVFALGFGINLHADTVLIHLRKPGETGYKIPHGGLYRWITCPNYFGEILEWTGWAIATWSVAGLSFALYTTANLAPRAHTHHHWYHSKFPDYPKERKALLPGLW